MPTASADNLGKIIQYVGTTTSSYTNGFWYECKNVGSGLYNGMIWPIRNYKVCGAIWYQGESNAGRSHEYGALMSALIENWRELWEMPDMPFLLVQLPNFMQKYPHPTDSGWARIREAQLNAFKTIPNTALAVNYDVGEWNDIHPLNKKTVAQRLFLGARKVVYGEKLTCSGPVYKDMKIEGNKIVITAKNSYMLQKAVKIIFILVVMTLTKLLGIIIILIQN